MKLKKCFILVSAVMLILCTGCSEGKKAVQPAASASNSDENSDIVVWGEVLYNDEYQISIDFPSTVTGISVKAGDSVDKGSTLITLFTEDYLNDIKKLKAQADSAKAALSSNDEGAMEAEINTLKKQISTKTKELKQGLNPDLKMLQTSLTQAEKDVTNAKSDLQKYQMLFSSGAISQSELDKYSDILDQKKNARSDAGDKIVKAKEALQEELDGLDTNLKYKEVTLCQQNDSAQMASAELDIKSSKMQKNYLSGNNIISNLNHGIVKEIFVVNGSVLGAQYAPQKVITLIDADSIYVSAEVPEDFITQISPNSEVFILPTADKDLKIKGQVIQIADEAIEKDGDRIVKVQIKLDDPDGILKPGYTADVHFRKARSNP